METEKPISTKEASDLLGVIPRTVVRLAQEGEIRGFKVRDTWRFYRSDINAYIQRQIAKARQQN